MMLNVSVAPTNRPRLALNHPPKWVSFSSLGRTLLGNSFHQQNATGWGWVQGDNPLKSSPIKTGPPFNMTPASAMFCSVSPSTSNIGVRFSAPTAPPTIAV